MGPLARSSLPKLSPPFIELVVESPHFFLSSSMFDTCIDHAHELPPDSVFEGRLPFDSFVIEIEGEAAFLVAKGMSYLYEDHRAELKESLPGFDIDNVVGIWGIAVNHPKSDATYLGGYMPGEGYIFVDPEKHPQGDGEPVDPGISLMVNTFDLLFSFMAEPRFVYRESVGPVRRKMAAKAAKKRGVPALKGAWVKVGWTIGKPCRAKGSEFTSGPKKAFHMVRAHWRRYEHQTKKSVRRPHKPGWWVWIEAQYRGHPALGYIRHSYQPKIDDPGPSSRVIHDVMASRQARV